MGGWGRRSRRGRQRACRDCHSPVNVRGWSARGRVAVRRVRLGTLRAEWQCGSHCQVASSAPQRYAQCRVAVRWVRSGPSGSATGVPGYARGRVAVRVTLPSGVERTATVRSGPSGSATGTLGAEWQCGSHCHLPVNVRRGSAQGRVAVRLVRSGTLGVEWQCGPGQFVDLRALHRRWDGPASGEAIFYGPRQPLG